MGKFESGLNELRGELASNPVRTWASITPELPQY